MGIKQERVDEVQLNLENAFVPVFPQRPIIKKWRIRKQNHERFDIENQMERKKKQNKEETSGILIS